MRVYHDFFWYPDPDQRFLIRIRPNDTDPTGSGSETLIMTNKRLSYFFMICGRYGGLVDLDR